MTRPKAKARLDKLLALLRNPAAAKGERESAGRRIGEILAEHPDLAGELDAKPAPKPPRVGRPKSQAKGTTKPAPPTQTARNVARMVRRVGQNLGFPKVAGAGHLLLDLLDEWEGKR